MVLKKGWIFLLILFFSCEKSIQLDVNKLPSVLVVQAVIENNQRPTVILSSSLDYFSSFTPAQLSASFVHGARVVIYEGTDSNLLREHAYSSTTGSDDFFYSYDSAGGNPVITGQFNHSYRLSIQTPDGTTYSASTTIPLLAKKCDSLWWKTAPANPDTNRVILVGRFVDPRGYGNYIRYFTSVNGEPFYATSNSVFDDEFTDGTTYDFPIEKAYSPGTTIKPTDADYGFFHRGDTVVLKLCNIDKNTYNFWNTWDFSRQSNGNPFSSPIQVIGNMSNGALGGFFGYAVQYKTLIIPR